MALEFTNRQDGSIDFERVEAVEGVLIANQIANPDQVGMNLPKQVESRISFDDGQRPPPFR